MFRCIIFFLYKTGKCAQKKHGTNTKHFIKLQLNSILQQASIPQHKNQQKYFRKQEVKVFESRRDLNIRGCADIWQNYNKAVKRKYLPLFLLRYII